MFYLPNKRNIKSLWNSRLNHQIKTGYGWTHGGRHDFYLWNNCNSTNSSYTSFGNLYQAPKDNNLLAGSYNFMLPSHYVTELVMEMAKLVGVRLRDPNLTGFAANEEASE